MSARAALVAIAAAIATLLLTSVSALADTMPFAATALSPADGGAMAPTDQPELSLSSDARPGAYSMWYEIATSPTPGQDGTLADEFTIGSGLMTEGDAFPDRFSATGFLYPALAPGTYYWQAHYTSVDSAPAPVYGQINMHVSPTFSFVVSDPTPPAPSPTPAAPSPTPTPRRTPWLSKAAALATLPHIIRRASRYPAHHLSRRCRRKSRAKFACRASWTSTRRLSRATWVYSGTLVMVATSADSVTYSFNGLRARAKCVQRRGASACARSITW